MQGAFAKAIELHRAKNMHAREKLGFDILSTSNVEKNLSECLLDVSDMFRAKKEKSTKWPPWPKIVISHDLENAQIFFLYTLLILWLKYDE